MHMYKKINPANICELAVKIESLSLGLYTFGAKHSEDPEVAKLCGDLALRESEHNAFFQTLLKKTRQEGFSDFFDWLIKGASTDDFIMQLDEGMESRVINQMGLRLDPALLAAMTPKELLRFAIQLEETGIEFYSGLEKQVKAAHKKYIIDLANEERRHLRDLLGLLKRLEMASVRDWVRVD